MNPPLPANEPARLAALRDYYILDTASEGAFEELVGLAAFVSNAPIAAISLVDEARQWFKAKVGIREQETPRDVAFCAHTIMGPTPFIVEDACLDARFAHSRLVIEGPRIRFYAGFPLISHEGFALGALCVADHEPHCLTTQQQNALRSLASQVMTLLDLRRLCARMGETLESLGSFPGLRVVCMLCRKIRDHQGKWLTPEEFLQHYADMNFSSGICPECFQKEVGSRQ